MTTVLSDKQKCEPLVRTTPPAWKIAAAQQTRTKREADSQPAVRRADRMKGNFTSMRKPALKTTASIMKNTDRSTVNATMLTRAIRIRTIIFFTRLKYIPPFWLLRFGGVVVRKTAQQLVPAFENFLRRTTFQLQVATREISESLDPGKGASRHQVQNRRNYEG